MMRLRILQGMQVSAPHYCHCFLLSHFQRTSFSSCKVTPWTGLQAWRESPLNHHRAWGPRGPIPDPDPDRDPLFHTAFREATTLAELGSIVLSTTDPVAKSQLSHLAYSTWRLHNLPLGRSQPPPKPARPRNPKLVSPKEIPAPKDSGLPLNAYMLHNLAHVELNAIDLAWDTVVRFSPYSDILGEGFFADFAHVADDESRHFAWCSQRLAELGFKYGDMPAHNLLWRECEKSSDNVAARLAVIPLVQEARGLDAGPRLVQKLVGFGDNRTSKIVARIADEEVAHVAVGVYWFVSVCEKLGCAPDSTFKDLLKEYNVELKGPFNYKARAEAGIPRDWYDASTTTSDQDKNDDGKKKQLSAVYERLASIIAMESENSSLNRPPQ
ncbi:uncharacterized protein LOC107462451 [Arachis duranensis]|uniref:Uncharacterized protein LOC107462451 n=1 Tax=Arachis duranensis TaxID=130453 RepID=A0A6P4BWT2_ARADU|nr:uncharacterized protein LOC107462451 [Arachis duranensis]